MGLIGILLGLALLIWLALRGWSVLLLAPAAALLATAFALEPLLANWTQTFMGSAAAFLAQFFPLFLLGALFGKLMDDSGCVSAIAGFMTERLGGGPSCLSPSPPMCWRRSPVRPRAVSPSRLMRCATSTWSLRPEKTSTPRSCIVLP